MKLGYGGTKEEMERLIKDANEYRASIGESSDLTIDSFADQIEAIQSIQEKQQIAGTTAREAATTIEGSVSAAKAAWSNFAVTLSGGTIDNMKTALGDFGESMLTVADNVVPKVAATLTGMGDILATGMPVTLDKVRYAIETYGPVLGEAVGHLLDGAGTFIAESGPKIAQYIGSMLSSAITNGLPTAVNAIPGAVRTIGDIIGAFIRGLLPEQLSKPLESVVKTISDTVGGGLENFGDVLGASVAPGIGALEVAFSALDAVIRPIGTLISALGGFVSDILVSALNGLSGATEDDVKPLSEAFEDFGDKAVDAVNTVTEVMQPFVNAICTALENIKEPLDSIKGTVKTVADTVSDFVDGTVKGATEAFETDLQPALENLSTAWSNLQTALQPVADAIGGVISAIMGGGDGEGLSGAADDAGTSAEDMGESFGSTLVQGISGALNTIAAIVQGITDIVTAITNLVDTIASVPEKVTGFFEDMGGKFDTLKSDAGTAFDGIKTKVGEWASDMTDKGKTAMANFKSGLDEKISDVTGFFSDLPGKISGAMGDLGGTLVGAGESIMGGFKTGIENIWKGIQDTVSGMGAWIAAHKGPISYDRTLLVPNGMAIMESLAEGLETGFSGVQDDVSAMAGRLADSMTAPKVDASGFFDQMPEVVPRGGYAELFANGGSINVYNLTIDGARVNQDVSQMTGDYLLELARIGAL